MVERRGCKEPLNILRLIIYDDLMVQVKAPAPIQTVETVGATKVH